MNIDSLTKNDLAIFFTKERLKLISSIFYLAQKQALPIAIWQLPQQKEINLVIDFSASLRQVQTDLEELASGFVVSPFANKGNEAWFIGADLHWQGTIDNLTPAKVNFSYRTEQYLSEEQQVKTTFLKELNQLLVSNLPFSAALQDILPSLPNNNHVISELDFEENVVEAIKEISKGTFRKVVLSRSKMIDLPANFEVVKTFGKVCEVYPHAFVSLISTTETGTWLGATPEVLVSVDRHKIFRTMALAGTQARGNQTNLSEVMWTQKEIEEQALVSRYIINCLKKIRVREFEEIGPKTVASGNLLHLRTDFEIDTDEINFSQLGTVMLELLHPTSAVCGMPKEEALKFIEKHEKYDRELYSGYLGQVNMGGESNIFVNLRCMQLLDGKAVLYAGAGITQDSNPQKEWKETEIKMNTMQAIL